MSRASEKEQYLKQYFWQTGGTITVQQALLGASSLTHAAIEALAAANKVQIAIPQGWLAGELRFYSDSADNTVDIVELYAAATSDSLTDHYRHVAQITLTNGTQEYGSNTFIDTVVPVANWLTNKGAVSPANNTFGSYTMNWHGYGRILVIASTLNSAALGIDYKKV